MSVNSDCEPLAIHDVHIIANGVAREPNTVPPIADTFLTPCLRFSNQGESHKIAPRNEMGGGKQVSVFLARFRSLFTMEDPYLINM